MPLLLGWNMLPVDFHYYVKVYGSKHICMLSLIFSWILQILLLKTKTVKRSYNEVTGTDNFALLQA